MREYLPAAIVLIFIFISSVFNHDVYALTVDEVSEYLMCQCGCNMTVKNCNHAGCPSAIPMRGEIKRLIDEGRGKDEIIAIFVSRYGETVRSVPTKSGFNLTAWTLPFVSIIGGGIIILFLLRAWVKKGKKEEKISIPEDESEYDRRIEEELKKID